MRVCACVCVCMCIYVCVIVDIPGTKAPTEHSPTQYHTADQGIDERHYSNTAGFYHGGRPFAATLSDERQSNWQDHSTARRAWLSYQCIDRSNL